jgi:adenine-specific DNA-methyltransferase
LAAIDDLIAQVEDAALRARLESELDRLAKKKKFGLVFEEHLPELTPVYSAKIRKGCLVALKGKSITDIWRVVSVSKTQAWCLNLSSGDKQEIPVTNLVVVRQFGEPIFPSLVPVDKVQNAGFDVPWHILIEADNYHALQLLEYLYSGQVDCIYIDPPYNTGARVWKYNNDYVDSNDRWRHSKWLAMMKRRLKLAIRLLKPTGILVVTVDDYEMHRLRCLIEDHLPDVKVLGIITIKNNPAGRSTVSGFAVAHEYAIFVGRTEEAKIRRVDRTPEQIARYKECDEIGFFEWTNFRKHGGEDTYRITRPRQFYPIYVHGTSLRIPNMKWDNDKRQWEILDKPTPSEIVVWPIDNNGAERIWDFVDRTANENIEHLKVRPDSKGNIGIYRKWRLNEEGLMPLTWWDKSIYSAVGYGTNLLTEVFGKKHVFQFPKSVYAVRDCIRAAGADNKDSLILDFFAGSGTTLDAVNLLNAADGGRRRCILVTNNEVSEKEAKTLFSQGHNPGDSEWEKHGICQSVAWPRCKFTILGKRDQGMELEDSYFSGRSVTKQKARRYKQISFTSKDNLTTAAKKKELVALIEGIPQSKVKKDSAFVISDGHPASILFDEEQADAWLEALEDQEHITDFYIVTNGKARFDELKTRINDMLGPIVVTEEEKRPMRYGFKANMEYFKLDFLEKDQVALGRQFREILPVLWLCAGSVGPRPELPKDEPIPDMLILVHNPFAVLIDETRFAAFIEALAERNEITYVFLVTDSEEAFQEMAAQLKVPNIIQLYRNYLENFMINRGVGL